MRRSGPPKLASHLASEHDSAIRRFFLEPKPTYTIAELAALTPVAMDAVLHRVYEEDLAEWNALHTDQIDAYPIKRDDALETIRSFNLLRPVDIERALGEDFSRCCPASWRTVPVIVHVPVWVNAKLYGADDGTMPLTPVTAPPASRIELALMDAFGVDTRTDLSSGAHGTVGDSR